MSTTNILDIRPETLAREQETHLRLAAVNHLHEVADLIHIGNYAKAREYLDHSPAGDGYGRENDYIDFSSIHPKLEDLGDVIERLEELHKMAAVYEPKPAAPAPRKPQHKLPGVPKAAQPTTTPAAPAPPCRVPGVDC